MLELFAVTHPEYRGAFQSRFSDPDHFKWAISLKRDWNGPDWDGQHPRPRTRPGHAASVPAHKAGSPRSIRTDADVRD
ncbi:MAG TPA: hypothetical protein VN045_02490 [Microbacteriaceae bacterium]|nr:hypothetical protein [Microbacteriaceae bacterium]